jgi:hypothetical protein
VRRIAATSSPLRSKAFAAEQDLNEQDVEELTRELERLGLEIGQPVAPEGPVAAKAPRRPEEKEEKEEEAPTPTVAISGSATAFSSS